MLFFFNVKPKFRQQDNQANRGLKKPPIINNLLKKNTNILILIKINMLKRLFITTLFYLLLYIALSSHVKSSIFIKRF